VRGGLCFALLAELGRCRRHIRSSSPTGARSGGSGLSPRSQSRLGSSHPCTRSPRRSLRLFFFFFFVCVTISSFSFPSCLFVFVALCPPAPAPKWPPPLEMRLWPPLLLFVVPPALIVSCPGERGDSSLVSSLSRTSSRRRRRAITRVSEGRRPPGNPPPLVAVSSPPPLELAPPPFTPVSSLWCSSRDGAFGALRRRGHHSPGVMARASSFGELSEEVGVGGVRGRRDGFSGFGWGGRWTEWVCGRARGFDVAPRARLDGYLPTRRPVVVSLAARRGP